MTAKSQKTAGDATHAQGSGVVNIVALSVSRGAIADIQSLAPAFQAGFRRCYDKGLQGDPDMKGSFRLTVRVGPNGEVTSVSPSSSSLSAKVVSCVSARVSATQFPPPLEGSATVVIAATLFPG